MGLPSRVADRVLLAMAYDRKSFKNKLLGILGGAVTHFYMIKLAELNGQSKWVQCWRSEVDRLINMDFVVVVVSEIKGRWDKRKAIEETVADLHAADKRYRTTAANYLARVYKTKRIKNNLPESVEAEFQEAIRQAADVALGPETES